MSETIEIVFMGTPEFALPTLEALVAEYDVVGVVTQPDRPAGRGRTVQPPPIKQLALTHDLPVFQPKSLRTAEALAQLQAWAPDIVVTTAIGFLLTPEVLDVPALATLNVHASLLPRWRGAAPIQAALLAGDPTTGVTIMCTDEGLDTGPILSQKAIPIAPRETAASLHDKLAQLGAELLLETLPRWLSGELTPLPQAEEAATYANRIRKADGLIDWERKAIEIDRQIRAYTPWPGAYTFWQGRQLKVLEAFPLFEPIVDRPAGTVVDLGDDDPAANLAVVTAEGLLRLDRLHLAGKRSLQAEAFVRGRPDFIGSRLEMG